MIEWIQTLWNLWDQGWAWPVIWKVITSYVGLHYGTRGPLGMICDQFRLSRFVALGAVGALIGLMRWTRKPSKPSQESLERAEVYQAITNLSACVARLAEQVKTPPVAYMCDNATGPGKPYVISTKP